MKDAQEKPESGGSIIPFVLAGGEIGMKPPQPIVSYTTDVSNTVPDNQASSPIAAKIPWTPATLPPLRKPHTTAAVGEGVRVLNGPLTTTKAPPRSPSPTPPANLPTTRRTPTLSVDSSEIIDLTGLGPDNGDSSRPDDPIAWMIDIFGLESSSSLVDVILERVEQQAMDIADALSTGDDVEPLSIKMLQKELTLVISEEARRRGMFHGSLSAVDPARVAF